MTDAIARRAAALPARRGEDDLVAFYREAGADYGAWSTGFNMHFGYWTPDIAPWDREAMTERMNEEVVDRLELDRFGAPWVLDLGCGVGATMRSGARRHPGADFLGVTIVDWQIEQAAARNARTEEADRLHLRQADYTRLPIPSASVQGAYALEAACHAPGADKAALISEAARVIEPDGRFVVADCFRKDDGRALRGLKGWIYRTMCESWAVPELPDLDRFVDALERHGFADVEVEDVSWKIAPSVLHVPFVIAKFLWQNWRAGRLVEGWRASNVLASFLAMLVGLYRWTFSYCIVTARRERDFG